MTIEAIGNTEQTQSVIDSLKARVLGAVKKASDTTGVDFSYLMSKAKRESNLDPAAKAGSSSATGLFQFIEQTWLRMVKEHGEKYGLDTQANKITICADGCARVADSKAKRDILELRKDPELNALMAAELTKDNKDSLQSSVGGKIGNTELYLAHFLGAAGAAKLIQAQRDNPFASAAALVPAAAQANRNVFYDRSGQALSVQQVYSRIAKSMEQSIQDPDVQQATQIAAVTTQSGAVQIDPSPIGASASDFTLLSLAGGMTPSPFNSMHNSLFATLLLSQHLPTDNLMSLGNRKDKDAA